MAERLLQSASSSSRAEILLPMRRSQHLRGNLCGFLLSKPKIPKHPSQYSASAPPANNCNRRDAVLNDSDKTAHKDSDGTDMLDDDGRVRHKRPEIVWKQTWITLEVRQKCRRVGVIVWIYNRYLSKSTLQIRANTLAYNLVSPREAFSNRLSYDGSCCGLGHYRVALGGLDYHLALRRCPEIGQSKHPWAQDGWDLKMTGGASQDIYSECADLKMQTPTRWMSSGSLSRVINVSIVVGLEVSGISVLVYR